MTPVAQNEVSRIFSHAVRVDWGVAVLVGEVEGKRRYLFEDGEERMLANGFYQLMRRVEHPNSEQRRAFARLCGVLAARTHRAGGMTLMDQITQFHAIFSAGFRDALWLKDVRGEGVAQRSPRHRQPLLDEARQRLSRAALCDRIEHQQFGQVWEEAAALLAESDLVADAKLRRKTAAPELERELAFSICELLHGAEPYEPRFDHFLEAFGAAFGERCPWELATSLPALVHPREHVCVDVKLFRRQLKLMQPRSTVSVQPSSTGYASFLELARRIAARLAEYGEVSRDLFDIRDFIAFTLPDDRPAAKAGAPTGAARQRG